MGCSSFRIGVCNGLGFLKPAPHIAGSVDVCYCSMMFGIDAHLVKVLELKKFIQNSPCVAAKKLWCVKQRKELLSELNPTSSSRF